MTGARRSSLLMDAARSSVLRGGPDGVVRGDRPPARMTIREHDRAQPIRLGLRENLAQFSLLVAVNTLVGGMIGQERTVLPLLATERSTSPRSPPRSRSSSRSAP